MNKQEAVEKRRELSKACALCCSVAATYCEMCPSACPVCGISMGDHSLDDGGAEVFGNGVGFVSCEEQWENSCQTCKHELVNKNAEPCRICTSEIDSGGRSLLKWEPR